MNIKHKASILYALIIFLIVGCGKVPIQILIQTENQMARQFYTQNHQSLFWFTSKKSRKAAIAWLIELENANQYGIDTDFEQLAVIRADLLNFKTISSEVRNNTDQQLTALVLEFIKELQEGRISFDYDEVWYSHDTAYVNQLLYPKPDDSAQKMTKRFDNKDIDYLLLKKFLNDSITPLDTFKYHAVIKAMNYQRYIASKASSEYIVVNIPETVARYYQNGTLLYQMRTVVGRKKTPTPTIASHITTIVTFPLWNVPHSIAVKEILPKVQQDEFYLFNNNLTVVDGKGIEIVDLDWLEYTERNFPYYFRQSTGSNNSLGVLKFDFENPYSVYLHSTNSQSGFLRDDRFLSHGCVRLEKPIELATSLLRGKLDIEALKIGKKNTESVNIKLPHKVPVFIIYSLISLEENKVTFLPDVYTSIQQR